MKNYFYLFLAFLLFNAPSLFAQNEDNEEDSAEIMALYLHFRDSLNQNMPWQSGDVNIGDDLATMHLPTGWRYLPVEASKWVLMEAWGNPGGETLGMLFPDNVSPIDEDAWATLYQTVSRPFPKPETGKIAVKVINDYGDEVMQVFQVD